MRILQINANVTKGGAARVMYRLHQSFNRFGNQAVIAARSYNEQDANIYCLADITLPKLSIYRRLFRAIEWRSDKMLAIPNLHPVPQKLLRLGIFQDSDIVQLHNIHGNYFNYHELTAFSEAKPTIWTLHDMWAITGHCAYAYDCLRWRGGCHHCPLLIGENRLLVEPAPPIFDPTRLVWKRKSVIYHHADLTVITPSRWLQKLAQESIIGKDREIYFIPNGVDLTIFKPMDRLKAKAYFGVPINKRAILFTAEKAKNLRKGFEFLRKALLQLTNVEEITLLVMGNVAGSIDLPGFHVIELGFMRDETNQAIAYNAADIMVFPSLADNQPLSVLEALACGTPSVAFDIGGIPEMIRSRETGYLVPYKDSSALKRGIEILLNNYELLGSMRDECRRVSVAEYDLDLQTSRYLDLYKETIEKHLQISKNN